MDMKDISPDVDPQETREWLEALDSVLENEGPERAHYLLEKLVEKARRSGANIPFSATTAYLNHLLAPVALGDYPALVAGLLPCFWLYADLGARLRPLAVAVTPTWWSWPSSRHAASSAHTTSRCAIAG